MGVICMAAEIGDLDPIYAQTDYYNESAGSSLCRGNFNVTSTTTHLLFLAAASEFWFSFRSTMNAISNGLYFTSGGALNPRLRLQRDGSNIVSFYRGDGTLLSSSAAAVNVAGDVKYDVHIKYGAAGFIELYLNGVLAHTFTGDTKGTQPDTTLNGFRLPQWSPCGEIFGHTNDTRSMRMAVLGPNGAGDVNNFSGAYTDVDEIQPNDADNLSTNATGQVAALAVADLPAVPGGGTWATVRGVLVTARAAATTDAAAQHLKVGVRIGGTNYLSADQALAPGYQALRYLAETSPATSSAFTPTEVNGMQVAVETSA